MEQLVSSDSPEIEGVKSDEVSMMELPASALELVGGGVLAFDF